MKYVWILRLRDVVSINFAFGCNLLFELRPAVIKVDRGVGVLMDEFRTIRPLRYVL